MSAGFEHPKVKVHVGDGFKFLEDFKNTFDVIITDSSDPEGPAESLFQKPYFQLLHDALREGGVITTQGCTSPLLEEVRALSGIGFRPGISTCWFSNPMRSLRNLPSGSSSRLPHIWRSFLLDSDSFCAVVIVFKPSPLSNL